LRFYAPWCGHCQKLAPAYEKAAKSLKGLAKIASVNCDEAMNKPLCAQFKIEGFPTLKIIRPSKKAGQPTIEDYQGARSAKAIVDAVVEKIPNHVKRVTDNSLQAWLDEKNGTAKAILFTEKGSISALLRALAIDYLGVINVGQVRSKEQDAVASFGVTKFPSLVLLPGGDKEPVLYSGELKKEPMSEFLSQAGQSNPDPAPEAPKKDKKAQEKKKAQKEKKEDKSEEKTAEEAAKASPEPPKPKPAPVIPTISEADLKDKCFSATSKLCALLLLPTSVDPQPATADALKNVALVYDKHSKRHASFPFFVVEPGNAMAATLRDALKLDSDALQVVAVNAKRMWWRRYPGDGFAYDAVEAWVDAIRMNEGKKEALPESLVPKVEEKFEDDVRERDEL
jgi:protein disulfide-isomerase A6